MDIKDLSSIMVKYNLSIRAVPLMVREVFDLCHKDEPKFIDCEVVFLPEFKREMLVRYEVPKNAGKFMCVENRGTCASVDFCKVEAFDTIEEAVENYLSNNVNK